jgi:hypothetical protein
MFNVISNIVDWSDLLSFSAAFAISTEIRFDSFSFSRLSSSRNRSNSNLPERERGREGEKGSQAGSRGRGGANLLFLSSSALAVNRLHLSFNSCNRS